MEVTNEIKIPREREREREREERGERERRVKQNVHLLVSLCRACLVVLLDAEGRVLTLELGENLQ